MSRPATVENATSSGAIDVRELPKWRRDEWGYHVLEVLWNEGKGGFGNRDIVRMWLAPRPGYCDRGRWMLQVDGIGSID